MKKKTDQAKILVEALPYIRAFYGKTIVIKYGGKAMVDTRLKEQFAEDVVLMKYVGINPVVVHGGGPQIDRMMRRLSKEPTFVEGIRVTDAETMEIVEMVLGGSVNKEIVSLINRQGGKAVGLTGKDGKLITACPLQSGSGAGTELGQVGQVESVDPHILSSLQEARFIPVISPVGVGRDGNTYNINADLVAGAIAAALKAEKLIILTDIAGIYGEKRRLMSTLSRKDLQRLIRLKIIQEGMLPKVQSCLTALEGGVSKAHIIDGRTHHALLLELLTEKGIGTEILA